MKAKLLTNILFEYGGMKKTMFKEGMILDAREAFKFIDGKQTDILDGYWVTNSERTVSPPGFENPGSLFEIKCFIQECEILPDNKVS